MGEKQQRAEQKAGFIEDFLGVVVEVSRGWSGIRGIFVARSWAFSPPKVWGLEGLETGKLVAGDSQLL